MLDADRLRLLFGPYRPPRCRVGGGPLSFRRPTRARLTARPRRRYPVRMGRGTTNRRRAKLAARDAAIAQRFAEGRTAAEVAAEFGLSRQRCHQIATQQGAVAPPLSAAEQQILDVLRSDPSRLFTRHELMSGASARAFYLAIERLRWKMGRGIVVNVKGQGYRLGNGNKARGRGDRPRSDEQRRRMREPRQRRMSEVQRRLYAEGQRPNGRPWTPAEDALLGTDSDGRIANRLGRRLDAVFRRRRRLGIPRSGKPAGRPPGTRNYEKLSATR
jgi:hypothetical protein